MFKYELINDSITQDDKAIDHINIDGVRFTQGSKSAFEKEWSEWLE